MDRSGLNPTFLETESGVLRDLAAHFERAWVTLPPDAGELEFERFLPPQGALMRPPALVALVKVDLLQRWRRGQRTLVEEYLQKFPELGTAQEVAPEVIVAEYQARQQYGDKPELHAYQQRFPLQFPQVRNMIGVLPASQAPAGSTTRPDDTQNSRTQLGSGPPPSVEQFSLPTLGQLQAPNTNFLQAMTGEAKVLQVGGGYKLLKRIGSGSFGEVWRAEAPGGVQVAMKIIIRPLDSDEAKRELQSLELIKRLKHPFLLDTQAFWSLEDRLLIVMELADGSLRDRLKECRASGFPAIPLPELITVFRESAEALDFLHGEGVQHRDIKPENILLLRRHAKVADFGLARVMQSLHVKSASMSGTPMYMAPEVWQGLLSPHSDQYSLAFTYTELRLGRPVFKGESLMEVMHHHLERQPDLDPLPKAEQEVLLRALAKNSEERYESCHDFMQELIAAVKDEPDFQGSGADYPTLPSRGRPTRVDVNATTPVKSGRGTGRPISLATQREAAESQPRRTTLLLGVGGLVLVAAAVGLLFLFNRDNGDRVVATPGETRVEPPPAAAFLPPDCVAAENAKVITLAGGRPLYDVIERVLPDGTRVPFRLIADPNSPVRPFYIMENKVTNALFLKFVKANPQEVRSKEWEQGALADGRQMGIKGHEQLPVFGVSVEDAHRCAVWLGGKLPTAQQWETAAGYNARQKGPYQHDPRRFDRLKEVAVNRAVEGPMPAGTATKDISPFGVRDMAGNGEEWTRTLFLSSQEVPVVGDQPADLSVELRGRSYMQAQHSTPLVFPAAEPVFTVCLYNSTNPDVSFRVVYEVP